MRAHTHMHSTHIQCIHSMLRIIKTNTKCTHHWRASLIDCVTVYQYLLALPGRRFLVSQPLEVMLGQKTCFCQWSISDVYHIHTKFKSSLCFATLFSICHWTATFQIVSARVPQVLEWGWQETEWQPTPMDMSFEWDSDFVIRSCCDVGNPFRLQTSEGWSVMLGWVLYTKK